jgi:hypothetical protein
MGWVGLAHDIKKQSADLHDTQNAKILQQTFLKPSGIIQPY